MVRIFPEALILKIAFILVFVLDFSEPHSSGHDKQPGGGLCRGVHVVRGHAAPGARDGVRPAATASLPTSGPRRRHDGSRTRWGTATLLSSLAFYGL